MKSKCSLCGKMIEVKPEHRQYGIKRESCKKKIASKLKKNDGFSISKNK